MSDIYLSLTETPTVVTLSQPVISGALSSTVTVANTVTVALDANSLSALENVTVTVGAAISVSNFPASQTVQGTVTVGSLPAISGSVTVNNFPSTQTVAGTVTVGTFPSGIDFGAQLAEGFDNYSGAPVQILQSSITLPISGTVTANVFGKDGTGTPKQLKTDSTGILTVSASGSVQCVDDQGLIFGSDRNFPISGTVTVGAMPNGALTTRFGSVTTASVAQLTSCVTNTSRKYLLAQNISAGTVTIGIGFSPTTTQGIQLTAGAGLTFDSFCPTGAVFWLGAVTGAAFTILEG